MIDLPLGPSAKVRDADQALHLRKLFEFVGSRLGLVLEIAITDGEQPIGRGIGPVLEARDVRAVLENAPDAPFDLRDKAIALAGRVLEFDPRCRAAAASTARASCWRAGPRRRRWMRSSRRRGRRPARSALGTLTYEVTARTDGWIEGVDCARIGRVARLAGAPTDVGAGVDLIKRKGDPVRAGEPLYRIHGVDAADFGFAREAADEDPGFRVVRT